MGVPGVIGPSPVTAETNAACRFIAVIIPLIRADEKKKTTKAERLRRTTRRRVARSNVRGVWRLAPEAAKHLSMHFAIGELARAER